MKFRKFIYVDAPATHPLKASRDAIAIDNTSTTSSKSIHFVPSETSSTSSFGSGSEALPPKPRKSAKQAKPAVAPATSMSLHYLSELLKDPLFARSHEYLRYSKYFSV
jgi:hypothetical protein